MYMPLTLQQCVSLAFFIKGVISLDFLFFLTLLYNAFIIDTPDSESRKLGYEFSIISVAHEAKKIRFAN